jgi:hypothetical protein
MKKHLLFALIFLNICFTNAQIITNNLENLQQPPFFGSSPFQNKVWAWDTTGFSIVYEATPTLSTGGTITGINGLTTHPCTGEIYGILKVSAVSGRVLAKFNPTTAVFTEIGNLGDNFSSITFREDGQLFGVTGDGATTPETLYLIDHTNAQKTLATPLGNGADGEIIAYNKDDNMIYHWSGNSVIHFEKIESVAPYQVTIISPNAGISETFGAVYTANNQFLTSNIASAFRYFSTTGTVSNQVGANTPDDIRGLALINRWIVLNGNDTICANDSTLLTAMGGQAYQWTLNGSPITGANASNFYAHLPGMYNCIITTDTTNCSFSAADTALYSKKIVTLNVPNVSITPNGQSYICNAGGSVSLTGSAGGTSQWYLNGAPIPSANTNIYTATVPGTYNMVKTNLNGCSDSADVSAIISDFTIVSSITPNGNITICAPSTQMIIGNTTADAYAWYLDGNLISGSTNDSIEVSQSGSYFCEMTFINCIDTSEILLLTVNSPSNVSQSVTICNNESYTVGNSTYTTAGIYSDTLTAINGCDSIVTTTLTVNLTTSATQSATICDGGSFEVGNNTYTTSGTYTDVLFAANGCDSTVITTISVIDCSGLENNSSASIQIYPNPADDLITLSLPENLTASAFKIMDLRGKTVLHGFISSTSYSINISTLSKGMYLLFVEESNSLIQLLKK